MPFALVPQTAPARAGAIGTPSAWALGGGAGASTSVRTVSGKYSGDDNRTYTFTVVAGGTIGSTPSLTISWTDGLGNTGYLNVGTQAPYTAGSPRLVAKNFFIAFGAGTVVATETFTVACSAANRLPKDAVRLTVDGSTLDVRLSGIAPVFGDAAVATDDMSVALLRVGHVRNPSLSLDFFYDAEFEKQCQMTSERHLLTLMENYDLDTLLLWRANGGLLPMLGPHPTFARSGVSSYRDRRTGLWRIVASGVPRYGRGRVGRAFEIDNEAIANLLPRFHPKSGTLGWTAGGGATATWTTTVKGVLDPDDAGWLQAFRDGTMIVTSTAGGSAHTDDTAVSAFTGGEFLTGQVWIAAGRGQVTLDLRAGAGAASNVRGTSAPVTLNAYAPTLITVTAATVGGGTPDTVADLRLNFIEEGLAYVSAVQLDFGHVPRALVQTDGAAASYGVETISWAEQMPMVAGTLSWMMWWPGDAGAGYYRFFETTGSTFFTRYNAATSRLELGTGAANALTGNVDLQPNTFNHVAFSWGRDSANNMRRSISHQGVQLATDSAPVANWDMDWGTTFDFARVGGGGASPTHAVRIEEVRLDRRALSAVEIADLNARLTMNAWLANHREHAGRLYRIVGNPQGWPDPARPDRRIMNMELAEHGIEPGSALIER